MKVKTTKAGVEVKKIKYPRGTFLTKKGTEVIKKKARRLTTMIALLILSFQLYSQPVVGVVSVTDDSVTTVQIQVPEAKSPDLTYWKGLKTATSAIPSKTDCIVVLGGMEYQIRYTKGATFPYKVWVDDGVKPKVVVETTRVDVVRQAVQVAEYRRKFNQEPPLY